MEKALEILKDFEESFKDVTIEQDGELEKNGIAWILYVREAIAELEEEKLNRREWYQKGYNEAMKPKTCEDCNGFVRNDYCHIIDDDCRVVMERCNGCKQFEPKDS